MMIVLARSISGSKMWWKLYVLRKLCNDSHRMCSSKYAVTVHWWRPYVAERWPFKLRLNSKGNYLNFGSNSNNLSTTIIPNDTRIKWSGLLLNSHMICYTCFSTVTWMIILLNKLLCRLEFLLACMFHNSSIIAACISENYTIVTNLLVTSQLHDNYLVTYQWQHW